MNKKTTSLCFAGIGLLLSLGLASCAPSVVAEGQSRPTPNPVATLLPYPEPTLDNTDTQLTPPPRPTRADGVPYRFEGLLVTPLPDEKVSLGQVVEIPAAAAAVPPRYAIRNEKKDEGTSSHTFVFIQDTQTGSEVRLGSDKGQALLGATSDDYVIWKSLCDGCADLKTGLYAYSIKTTKNMLVSNTLRGRGFPKIDGQWVIYVDEKDPSQHISDLHAHSLTTDEDLLIGPVLQVHAGATAYYTIQGGKVAWVVGGAGQNPTLRTYDLTHHTTQTLSTPEQIFIPIQSLGISENVVVWWSDFWQGYDLKRNAYFTIPIIPPGWENLPVIQKDLVTAEGNKLNWSLELDGETHYFSAPIVPKGQGAQPTHSVPTPHRKPTQSPVLPTPTSFSTAYP